MSGFDEHLLGQPGPNMSLRSVKHLWSDRVHCVPGSFSASIRSSESSHVVAVNGQAAAVLSPESSRREVGAAFPGLSIFLAAKKG